MKKYIACLLTICILLFFPIAVSATDTEMFSAPARTLSEDRKNEIVKHIKLELVENDNYKTGISSFAVSESGLIAVGIENDRIYVYDSNGAFQYGYYFKGDGAYGVAFAGENVAIYFVRGDFYAIYDSSGDCVAIKELTAPDYEQISRFLNRTTIRHADKTYTAERDVEFSGTYSRLVIIEEDGTQNTIYDISNQHSIGAVLMTVCIIGFFLLVIVGIIKQLNEVESWEGIWYCSELKMQISLSDPLNAFLIENGEKIHCRCEKAIDKYTLGILSVWCWDWECPRYKHGKTLFSAKILKYTPTSMVVCDQETKREYTFVRTDKTG